MLDKEDKTPKGFYIQQSNFKEEFKKIVRNIIYPIWNNTKQNSLEKKYSLKEKLDFDMVYETDRGTDYEAQRKRINKYKNIKDATVLIIGIGTGRDLESWLKYNPKKIISIDYFNYEQAWSMRKRQYRNQYDTILEFYQADILDMSMIKDESIDIIGSDAVFEHINKFDDAMKELYRILKTDGILYANFGPLWYCWGGDHISGRDDLKNGYNHIKLDQDKYHTYLDGFGEFNHNEEDGRTWINNNLFSYLKPKEYIDKLEMAGFYKKFTSALLEPRAIEFSKKYKEEFSKLEKTIDKENMLIKGMTIIYGK